MRRSASLFLILASGLSAQGQFQALAPGNYPPPPVLQVEERSGSILRAEDDRLLRIREGQETELACVPEEGTGNIRGLARHPSGTVFIAAENGLFITHPEVDKLDAVLYRDGVPAGPAIGVHVDRWDRLWLATERAFGPVHCSQFFGRSFGPDDGLPAPPFTGFAAAKDGTLILSNAQGSYRYRPDQGSRPSVQGVSIQGQSVSLSERLQLDGDSFVPQVPAIAISMPSLRWRRVGHHLLRPLAEEGITELKPGDLRIEFYALDRDLNLSPAYPVDLAVPYPEGYSKQFLLSSVGGTGLGIFLLMIILARRGGRRGPAALARGIGNGLILSLLGMQFLGAYLAHGRSYPFIGFTMYTEVYEKNSLTFTPVFYGLYEDGQREELFASYRSYTGLGTMTAFSHLLYCSEEERQQYLAEYRERDWWGHQKLIDGFELRMERKRLTASGPQRVAPIILMEWRR
ncbi:MAG: hypothetical protein ACYTG5_14590 [Planctomycetota bacterium]